MVMLMMVMIMMVMIMMVVIMMVMIMMRRYRGTGSLLIVCMMIDADYYFFALKKTWYVVRLSPSR
jgi:hypothetical protein